MSKVVRKIFGGGGSPGALGTGRFQATQIDISEAAFQKQIAGTGTQEVGREAQARLSAALEAQSRGEGPSVAEQQLRRGQESAVKRARASAAGTRAGTPGLTQREIARQTQAGQRETSAEAAQLRAQEQIGARQVLGQQLAQTREQDIRLAEQDRASLQALEQLRVQQATGVSAINQAGFASAAQQRGSLVSSIGSAFGALSDENMKKNIKDGGSAAKKLSESIQKSKKGSTFKKKGNSKKETKEGDKKKKVEKDEFQKFTEAFAKSRGDAPRVDVVRPISTREIDINFPNARRSSLLVTSDENQKKSIEPGGGASKSLLGAVKSAAEAEREREKPPAIATPVLEQPKPPEKKESGGFDISQIASLGALLSDENAKKEIEPTDSKSFLDKLKAVEFEFKDPKNGEGKQLGILAQDLEKAGEVGKSMVIDTPEGKMVDFGKGFGAILAATADLNKRLSQIESTRTGSKPKKKRSK